ncbi:MAG: tetratricopeptide repeat protein [Terriglobia bacterium]
MALGVALAREREPETAKVAIQAGRAGCQVDVDADAARATDATGKLTIPNVDPGDHYIHVRCPGMPEAAFFVSPRANEVAQIGPIQNAPPSPAESNPTALAEDKTQLRRLVQQAVQLRQQARLDEAVAALREATKLDPENADLHRELGITFLLAKEWKRARVEMIEAIRHDQTDADAHNGLGYALEKLGDIDGAVKEYRIATHLEPDDPSYRTHYFEALVKIQTRQETKK